MIALKWVRPETAGGWYTLDSVETGWIGMLGVYMIWHEGAPARVIRISQGDIGRQLQLEQISPRVLQYRIFGGLYVTWAQVPGPLRDGVERYLANRFRPCVGEQFALSLPLPATTPF
ncbi:MAG: hypothetical protein AB7L41_03150 [Flavobacteriaceae bacterium]